MTGSECEESGGATTRRGDEGTEEWTQDLHSVTTTEFASVELNSELLGLSITNSDVDLGFEVIQDGPYLGFSAGIIDELDDGPTVHSFHSLTLEEARSFHKAFGDAIEAAEEASQKDDGEKDHESFLSKLKGAMA